MKRRSTRRPEPIQRGASVLTRNGCLSTALHIVPDHADAAFRETREDPVGKTAWGPGRGISRARLTPEPPA
jgi:hypothetical protein